MEWSDVGDAIGKSAPVLGALFGPLGAGIGAIVSAAIGSNNTPDEIVKNIYNPDNAQKIADLESQITKALSDQSTTTQTTYQQELKSENLFVKCWRPAFGWAMVLTWIIESVGIFIGKIDAAIITSMQDQWTLAFMVLGINIYARSRDKGSFGAGIVGSFVNTLRGK